MPAVYFYLPTEPLLGKIPLPETAADEYWIGYQHGFWGWILQTQLHMKAIGYDCELVEELPDHGVIVFFGATIPRGMHPAHNQLFVHIKSDTIEHPYAQIHIVQNPSDPLFKRNNSCWTPYFIPYWLQPGIVPRDTSRGEQFENASFFGNTRREIEPYLLSEEWKSDIEKLSMNWIIQPKFRWNDYSKTDVTVGIRCFGTKPFHHKPFSKLVNAWRGQVPAILSPDSAYRALKRSELDYIEVTSRAELIEALKRLKRDSRLREEMVANGLVRAQELQNSDIALKWRSFLDEVAVPALEQWTVSKSRRDKFFQDRHWNTIRLEVERLLLESYAPALRNRPFDLSELKCETQNHLLRTRQRIVKKLIKHT